MNRYIMNIGLSGYMISFFFWPSFALAQSSTNYILEKGLITQGGSVSASENYQVIDAIGQPYPVGISASTEYNEYSGFFTGDNILTDVAEENVPAIPTEFALFQNYPNPFNPETEIRFDLPEARDVVLKIYDLLGREILTLINNRFKPGFHSIVWDGKDARGIDVSSGLYFYRLQAGNYRNVKKMSLLR